MPDRRNGMMQVHTDHSHYLTAPYEDATMPREDAHLLLRKSTSCNPAQVVSVRLTWQALHACLGIMI